MLDVSTFNLLKFGQLFQTEYGTKVKGYSELGGLPLPSDF